MKPELASSRLVRSCVIELCRIALEGSGARRGAAETLVRVASSAQVDSEAFAILKAALTFVGS